MTSRFMAVVMTTFLLIGGCSRGPEPPLPTEDLEATIVGVIASDRGGVPFDLANGSVFDPPIGATVRRLRNWPARSSTEPEEVISGSLLLGGEAGDGSWWYEIAGSAGPNEDGCWSIYVGSFDQGDFVQFSSGLRVPKDLAFEIRRTGDDNSAVFPGHQADSVCIDEAGRAQYFELFAGR
jgi:hypothetical protein